MTVRAIKRELTILKIFLNYQTASTNLINFLQKILIDLYKSEAQRNTDRHLSQEKKSSICKPISNYGRSKLFVTKHLVKKAKKHGFIGVVIRLFQVYGKDQEKAR